MSSRSAKTIPFLIAALILAVDLQPGPSVAQTPVPGEDEKFLRLRFADEQVSVNDRCPVKRRKLNPCMAPVYVNGRPVGFC